MTKEQPGRGFTPEALVVNKIETCGCGRLLIVHPVANLKVRLDSVPLEPDGAVQALIAGRALWRVTQTSVTGARPEELAALRERGSLEGPRIHQEHRCTAAQRTNAPSAVSADPKGSPRPPAGRSALPGSDRRTERSGAPSAGSPRSDGPRCDDCGLPLGEPGTYWGIQLGELWVYAQHVERCT